MTDESKNEAWRRRCSQLEGLGIDPYRAEVPVDDSRHSQVQAILTEYKVAIGEVIPVPPEWEGNPPPRPFLNLGDLDDWLQDQWDSILATEMGGEAYRGDALEQAARAVRNGFRVLAQLGVDERPERPLPAETLPGAKQQVGGLECWVRQKVKDGWTPPRPSQPEANAVSPATPRKRRRRDEFPDADEINILIIRHLRQNPGASIREIEKALNISKAKLSPMEAWQQEQARRNAAKPPPKIKEIQMRKKIEESIPKEDSMEDVDDRIDRREATWRRIIEEATPIERATLNAMSRNDKEALIDAREEQNADTKEQEKRRRWRRRECS